MAPSCLSYHGMLAQQYFGVERFHRFGHMQAQFALTAGFGMFYDDAFLSDEVEKIFGDLDTWFQEDPALTAPSRAFDNVAIVPRIRQQLALRPGEPPFYRPIVLISGQENFLVLPELLRRRSAGRCCTGGGSTRVCGRGFAAWFPTPRAGICAGRAA